VVFHKLNLVAPESQYPQVDLILLRNVLKYFDSFTAVSIAAADYLQKLTDDKIDIIPNGIDLNKYYPKPESKSKNPTIFYVGRLEKRKGLKYLLKAFAELESILPNSELIIAGDGPDREKLKDFADDLGIQNIRFLGFVDESTKIKYLQSSTVFCSPAVHGESFGIVLLEAMACGTVIVAGDNPGYSSVMQERGKLSLVNPRYTSELVRRLHLMLTDNELRDSTISWSNEYVKRYDYSTIVDQYEDLFNKLYIRRSG
jgi:phosphatidylinositol alpha-mannosyltransferase